MPLRRLRTWTWLPVLAPLVVFWPRITGGGLYGDDWLSRSRRLEYGLEEMLITRFLEDPIGHRALQFPYLIGVDAVFARSTTLQMLWTVLTAGLLGVLVTILLRRFGVPAWAAACTAALGVIFPYATITKIWIGAHSVHVSISLAIVGLLVALRGLERPGRGARIAHHAGALVLFWMSLSLYELALPVICAGGILYFVASRRALGAALRWAADLALVGAWYLAIRSTTLIDPAPDFALFDRLGTIFVDGTRNLAGAFVPFLAAETDAAGAPLYSGAHFSAAAGLLAFGLVVALAIGLVATGRLRGWGVGILIALAAGFAGWLAIVPSVEYYRPLPFDAPALRINALAAFGLAGVVVACAGAAGAAAGRWAVTAVLLAVIAVTYARHDRSEITLWNAATDEQLRVVAAVRAAYGGEGPPPGRVIFLTDNREFIADDAEVFHTSWSLRGALKTAFRDFTLEASPRRAAAQYECRPDGFGAYHLQFRQGREDPVPRYGSVDLVSVEQRRVWHIADRRGCERALAEAGLPAATAPPVPGTT